MFPFGQDIVLIRRVKRDQPDELGNDVYDDVPLATVPGAFALAGSVEQVQGQDVVTTQPTVYLPPGTVLTALDAVSVGGVSYEVVGVPQPWVNPFTGHQLGVEVRLQGVS